MHGHLYVSVYIYIGICGCMGQELHHIQHKHEMCMLLVCLCKWSSYKVYASEYLSTVSLLYIEICGEERNPVVILVIICV